MQSANRDLPAPLAPEPTRDPAGAADPANSFAPTPPSPSSYPSQPSATGERLAQDHRLAVQMRALAEIAPAVAHDLRAPINAMVLNLEVLRETVSSGRGRDLAGQERLLRYANVLRDELARLHRSLEIFLGHISPRGDHIETLDLRDLAGELASLLTAPARKQLVEVKARLAEKRVAVTANRYLLRQALLHFGLAALAAVPHPGRLDVELTAGNGHARLRIAGGAPAARSPAAAAAAAGAASAGAAGPAAGPPATLERLEVARSLLAAQGGEARVRGGAAGEGDLGFEIELPLSDAEVR